MINFTYLLIAFFLGVLCVAVPVGIAYYNFITTSNEKYIRGKAILKYRDDLIDRMKENDRFNVEYARRMHTREIVDEYRDRNDLMWKTWGEIPYETLRDSDRPLSEFYTQEVLEKLLWRFEPVFKASSNIIH